MKFKSNQLEWVYVFLFTVFLAYIGAAVSMNYSIFHSSPYGLSASDALGEVAYTEGLIDIGNYKYLPSYIRAGFSDTLGFHMPIYNHIVAIFTLTSNLPAHDSLFFIGFISSIFATLAMYLVIRDFNKNIAIMSLPLSIFLYIGKFKFVFIFGSWDIVLATFFLLCSLWVIKRLELKYSFIILSILLAGIALTHITEAIFLAIFLMIFYGLELLKRKIKLKDIIKLAIAGGISLVLSFYYLVIFKYGYGRDGTTFGLRFLAPEPTEAILSNFGWVKILLIIGFIISILLYFQKKNNIALLFAAVFLGLGLVNMISEFPNRAHQLKYMWPVYLMIFLGVIPYFIGKLMTKKWNLAFSIIISILLTATFTTAFYQKETRQGLVSEYHWNHMMWTRQNTPQDARFLYFYGDPYTQEAVIWNMKRLSYRIDLSSLISAINERTIKRSFYAEVAAADDAELFYRNSFFDFRYKAREINKSKYFGDQDICEFEYFVMDKQASNQPLVQYNLLMAQALVNYNQSQVVFDNGVVLMIENKNVGGDCIEERSLEQA